MDLGDTSPAITEIKQEENRKPGTWLPGQSGNPNGRPPKGLSVSETIRDMINGKPDIKKALASKLLEMALRGDLQSIKELLDRIEGKPMFRAEVSNVTPPQPILGSPLSDELRTNDSDPEAPEPQQTP